MRSTGQERCTVSWGCSTPMIFGLVLCSAIWTRCLDATFFIVWDQHTAQAAEDAPRYERLQVQPITKDQLFDFITQFYSVDRNALVEDCRAFPLLLRILLAMYLRKVAGIDYCIMADNDILDRKST